MKSNFSVAKTFCTKRMKRCNKDKMLNGASPQMSDQRSVAGPIKTKTSTIKKPPVKWRFFYFLII